MAQAPYMPIFTDALLGDTTQLSIEEFGAYCMLLFVTWRNNGLPLANDDKKMARICRVSMRRWQEKLRPALEGFFDLRDGFWHQRRLEKEWQFVAERAAISRDNGARGGRPNLRKSNETENPAGSFQVTQNETPHTHTQLYTPKSPAEQGTSNSKLREEGTNPRATGDNPRKTGANPRANGANPRASAAEFLPEPPWEQRCAGWVMNGFWLPQWGPKPDEGGCLAPVELAAAAVKRRSGEQQEAAD